MMGFIVKKVLVSIRLFVIEKYAKTRIRCLEITLLLKEKSKKLNNKKLLTCIILSFSNFKLLLFLHQATLLMKKQIMDHFFCQTSQRCDIKLLNLLLSFLCSLLINWTPTFFMHDKCVLIFLLTFDLVSFFPLCLKRSIADTSKFSVLRKEKMYKTKTTKNELKMHICSLTLYLNHFNENKPMFGNTLKNFFSFLLRQSKVNLRTLTYIFYKSTAPTNINSAAFGTFFKKSAFCGRQICLFCGLQQHLLPLNSLKFYTVYLYCMPS